MNILNRLQAAVLAILMLGTLTGCGGGAASGGETGSGDPVRIATKPMTEQYILGEMLGLLIEQAGYDVEITKGVGGGTSNIQPAMESGEFDLYPEYTSSGWVLVLDHQAEGVDDAEMFTRLQQEYEEKFHMTWVGKYGFNNTFTVAVRGDVAEQYGLETTSDLAGAAGELTFGGNPDYLARDVHSVTGVDIAPEMARRAAEKFPDARVTVRCGDIETVPLPQPFDCCMVYNAFPHFPDPARLIAHLATLLKPSGRLSIAHGMSRAMLDRHHAGSASTVSISLISETELAALMTPYFDVDIVISDDRMYQVCGTIK